MAYPPPSPANDKTDDTVSDDDHAPHHNELADAVIDIVTELGTAPSGAEADVTARLAAIDAAMETPAGAQAKVDTHTADAADAHDASAVSVVPTGDITETNAQDAIVEAAALVQTVDFTANINVARPATSAPVIWTGATSSTPTNVNYGLGDFVIDTTAGGGLTVQEENANVATGVTQLDFQGAGVTATAGSGEVIVTIPGGAGGSIAIEEDGVEELAAATRLNFTGDITVTDAGSGEATVNVTGGGGTSDLFVRKTADTPTRTLNTTLADDNELTLAVEANKTYVFSCVLIYLGDDGGDLKVQFNGPAGATLAATALRPQDTTTAATTNTIWNSITLGSSRAMGAVDAVNVVAKFDGILRTAGTAGNFTLQWAQNTSFGTGTTILTDSFIKLQEIA